MVNRSLPPFNPLCASASLCLCVLFVVGGCSQGPAVGTVRGAITMDGQPLDGNALIRMVPKDSQSQPADCIVKGGAYSITMPVGEKKVEIYWTKTDGISSANTAKLDTASQGSEKVVVLVPAKYNTETTLTYMVEKGTHTQDFALTK